MQFQHHLTPVLALNLPNASLLFPEHTGLGEASLSLGTRTWVHVWLQNQPVSRQQLPGTAGNLSSSL